MYKHTHVFAMCFLQASAIFSSFGTEFLLALPIIMNEEESGIQFFLVAKFVGEVDVALTTPNFKPEAQTLNEMIILLGKRVHSGLLNRRYYSKELIGLTSTYRFNGNGLFSLYVLLSEGGSSSSTLQALPIDAWDKKYLVVTLLNYSTMQVISSSDRTDVVIKFRLKGQGVATPEVVIGGQTYKDGGEHKFTLNRWQAYAVSFCNIQGNLSFVMTGSAILGTYPIGVVSGSCRTSSRITACANINTRFERTTHDSATEMLLPDRLFGNFFVIAETLRRQPKGSVIIVASEDKTHVNITTDQEGNVEKFFLAHASDFNNTYRLTERSHWLVSDKKIQVIIILRATCLTTTSTHVIGGSAMSTVVPNSHFSTEYLVIFPAYPSIKMALIVVEYEYSKDIKLDGKSIWETVDWNSVLGNPKYNVGGLEIFEQSSVITSPQHHRFGCYLLGFNNHSQYMHSAGFEGCVDTSATMKPEDTIDNDCDSNVDEEQQNNLDDDADGRVDEDLGKTNIVDGAWGAWQAWACYPNCSYKHFYRSRRCNAPPPSSGGLRCPGVDQEFLSQTCKPNISCPVTCDNFTWGEHCEKTCDNCETPCDPADGSCSECRHGYKTPQLGCNKRCGHNEYGKSCLGKCAEKCGTDCVNRTTGECPPEGDSYVIYAPLLVVIPVIMLLIVVSRKHFDARDSWDSRASRAEE